MKVIIDGRAILVEKRRTILDVARENGIRIPSLCDHPLLTPFAACRLCLVQIKGRKGFSPACSTYLEEGMDIQTGSPEILSLRKKILELILSEHPSSCLICGEKSSCDDYKSTIRKTGEATGCVLCPENGRCGLQEVVEAVGIERLDYPILYRDFEVRKDDPFIDRNYNLCILCGRCVRVCHEVRGARAITFINRGPQASIGTAWDRSLLESGCQFCGACLDVCPTGALAERAARPEGRPDGKGETVCPLCSLGCGMEVDLKRERILSSIPLDRDPVNQGQACVKGRFVLRDAAHSPLRILQPSVIRDEEPATVGWDAALETLAAGLAKSKREETAFFISPELPLEDAYLIWKFAKEGLGIPNVSGMSGELDAYHRFRGETGIEPVSNFRLEDIAKAKAIFVLDTELCVSHPLIWLAVIQAKRHGARLVTAASGENPLSRCSDLTLRIKPGSEKFLLGFLSRAAGEEGFSEGFRARDGFAGLKNSLDALDPAAARDLLGVPEEDIMAAAQILLKKPAAVLFGRDIVSGTGGRQNLAAVWNFAQLTGARFLPLFSYCDERGIYELGKFFAGGRAEYESILTGIATGKINAVYAAGEIIACDGPRPAFLACATCFPVPKGTADIVLPAATFSESSGHFINAEGRLRGFSAVTRPQGTSRPHRRIIVELARKMGLKGFAHEEPASVFKEIGSRLACMDGILKNGRCGRETPFVHEEKSGPAKFVPGGFHLNHAPPAPEKPFQVIFRDNESSYAGSDLARENRGLRKIRDSRWVRISAADAVRCGVSEGDEVIVDFGTGGWTGIARFAASLQPGVIEIRRAAGDGLPGAFRPGSFAAAGIRRTG